MFIILDEVRDLYLLLYIQYISHQKKIPEREILSENTIIPGICLGPRLKIPGTTKHKNTFF